MATPTHQRQIIRGAVQAILLAKTAAGAQVFKTRMVPYRKLELPAIAIYALQEPVDPESKNAAPRELTRNLQLVVEAAVKADEGVDDALDAIALEIERAMHADPTLGGAASDALLSNTELTVVEESQGRMLEQPLGIATLTYAVRYYTYAPDAADVTLDDLRTVDAKTSLGGAVAAGDQAEDKLQDLDKG